MRFLPPYPTIAPSSLPMIVGQETKEFQIRELLDEHPTIRGNSASSLELAFPLRDMKSHIQIYSTSCKWLRAFLNGSVASSPTNTRVHLHAALLVILQLDIAQETHMLFLDERDFRASLKRRVISLEIIAHARKKKVLG
jgi:hypothetical protein